jgi:diaminopimelate decarboxylase
VNQIQPLSYKLSPTNEISFAGIKATDLVKKFASPLYVLCEETLRANARSYTEALKRYYPNHLVLFASKSLNTRAVCRIIEDEGLGIDVVSGGELYTALSVKFAKNKIFFHGNNKSRDELEYAIDSSVNIIIDNHHEIDLLEKILRHRLQYDGAAAARKSIKLMLRITPGIECHTHEYIKTGMIDSKFGFVLEQVEDVIERLLKLQTEFSGIHILGLHAHIGSQIFETDPQCDAAKVLLEKYASIKSKFNLELEDLNVGGGLGISYTESDDPPSAEELVAKVADSVTSNCERLDLKLPRLLMEPGRSIVGPAGATIYTVGNIKTINNPESGKLIRKYVAIDGGMADNTRPIMYGARYHAEVNGKASPRELVSVAGKYCESGDILIKDVELPVTTAGDLLIVFATGAYNYSMSSNYNRVVKPAMVLVNDGEADIIIERENFDDIVRNDKVPKRLSRSKHLLEQN